MAHVAYEPVGYDFNADHYCLDCIVAVIFKPNETYASPFGGHTVVIRNGGNGTSRRECNCTEHRLDRIAAARGINRMDERSFDSGDFPKAIPYHNDLHSECGPEHYGYGPDDPEWQSQYCGATCARCHAVIDGVSKLDGPDVCPAFDNREVPA